MASINDRITETFNGQNPTSTTVQASRAISGTTLTCTSLAGWPTATAVHFATYQKDSNNVKKAGTQIDWKGVVSGSSINTLTRQGGAADGGNSVGDIVEMMPTNSWANDLAKGLESTLNQDGTLKSSLTITTPTLSGAVSGTYNLGGTPTLTSPVLAGTATGSLTATVLSNPYKFSVYRNAAYTTANAWPGGAAVVFDTKLYDTSTNFSISTGLFTAPINGFYQFSAYGGTTLTGGVGHGINLIKNGSAVGIGSGGLSATGSFTYVDLISDILQLSAGDTVGVNIYASANAGGVGINGNRFSGFLMSAT